jgi:hypothetical protein
MACWHIVTILSHSLFLSVFSFYLLCHYQLFIATLFFTILVHISFYLRQVLWNFTFTVTTRMWHVVTPFNTQSLCKNSAFLFSVPLSVPFTVRNAHQSVFTKCRIMNLESEFCIRANQWPITNTPSAHTNRILLKRSIRPNSLFNLH